MIQDRTIQQVLEQANIADVVGAFIDLKESGQYLKACCPFHEEKTPSFVVSPAKNIYKCFGCGVSGGPITWLKEYKKMDFPEAIKWLADYYNIPVEYTGDKEDADTRDQKAELYKLLAAAQRHFYTQLLDLPVDHPAAEYLLHWRQYDIDTIQYWGLGYAPDEWQLLTDKVKSAGRLIPSQEVGLVYQSKKGGRTFDAFRNRITIPIHDHQGNLVGFGARTLDPEEKTKYLNSSASKIYNKSQVLFGLYQAANAKAFRKAKKAYLMEGYTDVISWHQAGHMHCVATCGTALTHEHARLLKRYVDHVVICYDNDAEKDTNTGRNATIKAIDVLLQEGFKVEVAMLPDGIDPDEYVQQDAALDDLEQMDGVDWKAEQLMTEAGDDPHAIENSAMAIAKMLAGIGQRFARESYINRVADQHRKHLKKTMLKNLVKDLTARHLKQDEKVETDDWLPGDLSDKEREDYKQYHFYAHQGRYWSFGTGGQLYDVTNFTMEILYHVETSEEKAYRLIKITNVYGHERVIQMNTDDFVSVGAFKKVVARKGNFIFKGNDVDLNRLQEKLQREECTTKRVDILGYHARYNLYVFANGVIDCNRDFNDPDNLFEPTDDYGIVHHEDMNLFIPAMSRIHEENEDEFANDRKFRYIRSNVTFKDWADQYHKVHKDKGKIGMAFYISSLFRDIIKETLDNRFPLLNLYGIYEAGKTSFAESLLYMWGEPQQPLELGGASTPIGYARSMAQFSNALVFLDEYSNSLNKKYIDFLKGIYQGTGYTRGRKDNSVRTDNIINKSAAILAGQEMPTWDQALFTRVIMLVFDQKSYNQEEKKAFDRLMEMQRQGLSHITGHLLKYRNEFKKRYKELYKEKFAHLRKEVNDNTVSNRMVLNNACLSATIALVGEMEELPFTQEEFDKVAMENMMQQHRVMAGSDDVQKFWDVVEDLFKAGQIHEGSHFELKNGELWLSLKNVYGLYEKEMRQRGNTNVIDKSTLRNYLEIDKSIFLGNDRKAFGDGSYPRIMRFAYSKLDLDLIRIKDPEARQEKLKEMGADRPDEVPVPASEGEDDLPF